VEKGVKQVGGFLAGVFGDVKNMVTGGGATEGKSDGSDTTTTTEGTTATTTEDK